ncbi:MAG TPA: MnhB domain-containing protein [Acidimicrobiales bacterium]|jgi:multisubunit Na+/H+ antiporter MnhB subunit|nr:MnhB domain-containing protein [Acidimicrobiales bacterium]
MHERRSIILDVGVDAVFHTILVFSIFLLFAGHNAPGGGFVGGLVAGAAMVLLYLEGGAGRVAESVRVEPVALLGAGLALAALTAIASLVAGNALLESAKLELDLPLLGEVKATSALPFDIGVYLVVVGLVLMVLRTLGAEDGDGGEQQP